jgi:hypothetical protein
MQVSNTLIAAQLAAREARARLQAQHGPQNPQPPPAADFARALEKTAAFAPLPLRQTAEAPAQTSAPSAPPAQGTPARMGSRLDVTV